MLEVHYSIFKLISYEHSGMVLEKKLLAQWRFAIKVSFVCYLITKITQNAH